MTYPGGYNPNIQAPGAYLPPPQAQWAPPQQQPAQGYPTQPGYPQQQPMVQYNVTSYTYQEPQAHYSGAVTKTRPPFPHGKHIRWTVMSLGVWSIGYGIAYAWHRLGPTKAVSHTRYV